jgi:hypothetical protein
MIEPSQLQCGIAAGRVVTGNVRGKERIEYIVVDETVNGKYYLSPNSPRINTDKHGYTLLLRNIPSVVKNDFKPILRNNEYD